MRNAFLSAVRRTGKLGEGTATFGRAEQQMSQVRTDHETIQIDRQQARRRYPNQNCAAPGLDEQPALNCSTGPERPLDAQPD